MYVCVCYEWKWNKSEKGAIVPIDFIMNLTVDLFNKCENSHIKKTHNEEIVRLLNYTDDLYRVHTVPFTELEM